MIAQDQITMLYGCDVYDRTGDKIGSVGQVWNDAAGQPAWASVKTGLFGLNESLVPLTDADLQGERLVVAFDKAQVKDAPNIDASHDEPLDNDEVGRLYEYYGLSWDDSYRSYQTGATDTTMAYRTDDDTDMSYHARLRKYSATGEQQTTVPVRRDEARLEREHREADMPDEDRRHFG